MFCNLSFNFIDVSALETAIYINILHLVTSLLTQPVGRYYSPKKYEVNTAKRIQKHLYVLYIYMYIYTHIHRLCMWRQWIHFLQILQQTILKGGMFTKGHSWVANAYSRKYLSICLTLNFKLYWVSRGSKHVLKILLVSYNQKLTIVCPDVRPYA